MNVSGPELTALDLLRYIHVAGSIDAVATVIADLIEKIDGAKLAALAAHFERTTIQRLGYLMDRLGYAERVQALHEHLFANGPVSWIELEPQQRDSAGLRLEPIERNERWRVNVKRHPEIDE